LKPQGYLLVEPELFRVREKHVCGVAVMPWLRNNFIRLANCVSLVNAMPPSPVVMILTG